MMNNRQSQVLVDLSIAIVDYAGIPMESRLLFKGLSECSTVNTTGLICPLAYTKLSLYSPSGTPKDLRIERQALALKEILATAASPEPAVTGRFARWAQRFQKGWQVFGRHWAHLEALDSEMFWSVIWRYWLGQTLTDEDVPLARRPMMLADISLQVLKWKANVGMPGPRIDTRKFDFAIFHQPRPIRVSRNTCKVVRHYDAIPIVRPDMFYRTTATLTESRGLRACSTDSIFTCISEGCRDELIHMYPHLAERTVTIPCTLATDYFPDYQPQMLPDIIAGHTFDAAAAHPPETLAKFRTTGKVPPYLLLVSTIEPRKNHLALLDAFDKLIASGNDDLCIVFVGSLGWEFGPILQRMAPFIRMGRLFHLKQVPKDQLRVLYSHARGVVFPSFIEGFGYSPLEAMLCGTPAIASDIPVHRGVYGDAVEYCDPYRVQTLVDAIERVCFHAPDAFRSAMIERGFRRVKRYQLSAVAHQWQAFLDELQRQRITHNVKDARLNDFNQELRRLEKSFEDSPPQPARSAA